MACSILVGLVAVILVRALPALSLDLLTQQMAEAGASGGILYEILGTLLLMASALVVSSVFAVALALAKTVYVAGSAAPEVHRAGPATRSTACPRSSSGSSA